MSWSFIKLIDCCEFLDHLRKPVKQINRKEGEYPYYGANGKQGTINDYIFDEDLVLLAEDGGHFRDPTRGIAYKISGKSWVNNHAHVLRPKNIIDINYLHYSLNQKDIRKYLTGSTRDKLTKSGASNIEIPLPPLDEQRRIAKILDTAINLQRKQAEINKSLLELEKNIFVEFFGDPLFNKKSLPLVPLEQLGKLDRGMSKHRPRNDPSLLGGPYPLIQTGDVANSFGLINSYHSTYSELGLKQSKLWKAGTLCITIAANIAKTGILKIDACFPDSVVGFTSEHPENIYYVRTWLSFLQKTLEQQAPESAQKNINLRLLRELKVPYPPLDQMKRFLVSIQSLEKLKLSAKKKAETLNLLVTSLSSNLLKEKVK